MRGWFLSGCRWDTLRKRYPECIWESGVRCIRISNGSIISECGGACIRTEKGFLFWTYSVIYRIIEQRRDEGMNKRTKLWIQLITGIILLLFMFWIPEFAALVFAGLAVWYIGKKLWNVPVGTIKRKRK